MSDSVKVMKTGLLRDKNAGQSEVLPAGAGMVPPCAAAPGRRVSAPRTCGDGPLMPIHPGWDGKCSPCKRGWPHLDLVHFDLEEVLPAQAGMAPQSDRHAKRGPAPCTCEGFS